MNYYRIKVLGGHVGSGNHILLTFAVKAKDIYSAIHIAKNMPMVKHNKNNVIQELAVISEAEYKDLRSKNAYDTYDPMKEI